LQERNHTHKEYTVFQHLALENNQLTWGDFFNEVFHENNLADKEFHASLRIINPPPILDQIELGNTSVKK
jgi:hypothetical protein